jgi:hypothetical protein
VGLRKGSKDNNNNNGNNNNGNNNKKGYLDPKPSL